MRFRKPTLDIASGLVAARTIGRAGSTGMRRALPAVCSAVRHLHSVTEPRDRAAHRAFTDDMAYGGDAALSALGAPRTGDPRV